jgi:hypothetical protein
MELFAAVQSQEGRSYRSKAKWILCAASRHYIINDNEKQNDSDMNSRIREFQLGLARHAMLCNRDPIYNGRDP